MGEGFGPYYDATAGRPPRPTLLKALELFGSFAGAAVDLGCGDGRDTVELLQRGWSVFAIDAEAEAIARLRARTLPAGALLHILHAKFEAAEWLRCDVVNASFALPLCPPTTFPSLWRRIKHSLRPGGRFAGQLYGPRDDWAARADLTHHDRASVEALLAGFEVEMLDEEESDTITPRGRAKHWHIFHIVARLRTPTA